MTTSTDRATQVAQECRVRHVSLALTMTMPVMWAAYPDLVIINSDQLGVVRRAARVLERSGYTWARSGGGLTAFRHEDAGGGEG